MEDRENACVLHDRNVGLLNVVDKLKNGRDIGHLSRLRGDLI